MIGQLLQVIQSHLIFFFFLMSELDNDSPKKSNNFSKRFLNIFVKKNSTEKKEEEKLAENKPRRRSIFQLRRKSNVGFSVDIAQNATEELRNFGHGTIETEHTDLKTEAKDLVVTTLEIKGNQDVTTKLKEQALSRVSPKPTESKKTPEIIETKVAEVREKPTEQKEIVVALDIKKTPEKKPLTFEKKAKFILFFQ